MPKYLHLQIPEPCHEDWNKMYPQAQGRFCNSCQKTVTDFTNMSDAQLIAFFKNPKPSVCGRFAGEQLERDILIPRKRIPWIKYFFQFVLPAFLLSLKSSAQMGKIKTPVEKVACQKNPSALLENATVIEPPKICSPVTALKGRVGGVAFSLEATRKIRGTVTDYDGIPLAGASVLVKGTNTGTVTDTSGNFSISGVRPRSTILVSYVGYQSKEIITDNSGKPIDIPLSPYLQGLVGEVVVTTNSIFKKKNKSNKRESYTRPVIAALSVYPNPLKSSAPLHLQWQNLEEGNYRIEVYGVSGALLKSQKLVVDKGLKQTSLTINELIAGNYFIRLINEKTGRQLSQQFMVQE